MGKKRKLKKRNWISSNHSRKQRSQENYIKAIIDNTQQTASVGNMAIETERLIIQVGGESDSLGTMQEI